MSKKEETISPEPTISNPKDLTLSPKSSDTSPENSMKNIFKRKSTQDLYASYKRDLGISHFNMKRAIQNVGQWIINVENNRNLQMRSDFDEEKEFKLKKQKEIQSHIEELSQYYNGEIKITYFNDKIRSHKELCKKYDEIKDKINDKIRNIKSILPELENKIINIKIQMKKLNKENLKLMEQVNNLENELSTRLEEDLEKINLNLDNNNFEESKNLNNSGNSILTNSNNSSMINNSINISDILEKNEELKKKKEKNDILREYLRDRKNENDYIIKNINQMNNNFFRCKRIYREGMYEIAKELLRINEIELDKVINNSNTNFNSLYFDIYKTNYNSKVNSDLFKKSIINDNIKKKFKYPIVEKAQPNDLLYKVVKNIIDENNTSNKINNIKKNKFSWEEFKDFSAYQIYTLLNINKEVLDKLDTYIFN